MEILLDNVIVPKSIHKKVVTYLNQPRKALDCFPKSTYPKMEYGLGTLFKCDLFAIRVENTWEALQQVNFVREPSTVTMTDIVTYFDSDENPLTLHVIINEDNDIIIISLEEESDDGEYWMGIAYVGHDYKFTEILSEMGIDLTRALRGELTEPKPAPNGYDSTLPIAFNVEKVCEFGGTLPDSLGVLATLMINNKGNFNYQLSSGEHHALTYEDMCWQVGESDLKFITYRDNLDENTTYVMIYSKNTGQGVKQMVLRHKSELRDTLVPNPDYHPDLLKSVKKELW